MDLNHRRVYMDFTQHRNTLPRNVTIYRRTWDGVLPLFHPPSYKPFFFLCCPVSMVITLRNGLYVFNTGKHCMLAIAQACVCVSVYAD